MHIRIVVKLFCNENHNTKREQVINHSWKIYTLGFAANAGNHITILSLGSFLKFATFLSKNWLKKVHSVLYLHIYYPWSFSTIEEKLFLLVKLEKTVKRKTHFSLFVSNRKLRSSFAPIETHDMKRSDRTIVDFDWSDSSSGRKHRSRKTPTFLPLQVFFSFCFPVCSSPLPHQTPEVSMNYAPRR